MLSGKGTFIWKVTSNIVQGKTIQRFRTNVNVLELIYLNKCESNLGFRERMRNFKTLTIHTWL